MKNRWPTRLALSMGPFVAILCMLGCAGNGVPPKIPANGALSFVHSSNPTTGISPAMVVAADFRGTGKLDLAVPLFGGGVSVLLGNSNGSFRGAPPFQTKGNDVNNAAVADFNGDGKPDLVIVLPYLSEIQVLVSNGDGMFAPMAPILIPDGVDFVATGDFNGDGKADIVAVVGGANELSVLLGNGDGTFTATPATPVVAFGVLDVVVGDFNGDGISDLAVQNVEAGNAQGRVTILLGSRGGTFTTADNLSIENPSSYMVVGDFNGDGILDLAGSTHVGGSCPSSGSVSVMLGNGDGTFKTAKNASAGLCPSAIAVGDFNRDGISDLVTLNFGGTMTVLLGNGDGTFAGPLSFAAGADDTALAVGDFNGDGLTDVAVVENQTNSIQIFLAHWTPTAAAPSSTGR